MKKRAQKKSDFDDLIETVIYIKDNMMTKSEGATKDDIANMATKEDIVAVRDDVAELRGRLISLEKGQEKILDTLEPLSRAHEKDSVTILEHGRRITRIEKHVSIK